MTLLWTSPNLWTPEIMSSIEREGEDMGEVDLVIVNKVF